MNNNLGEIQKVINKELEKFLKAKGKKPEEINLLENKISALSNQISETLIKKSLNKKEEKSIGNKLKKMEDDKNALQELDEEKKPMIIIISDVHLGAWRSKPRKFKNFLRREIIKKIKNDNNFKNSLKSVIILGDFFDVCLESCNYLSKKKNIKEFTSIYMNFK